MPSKSNMITKRQERCWVFQIMFVVHLVVGGCCLSSCTFVSFIILKMKQNDVGFLCIVHVLKVNLAFYSLKYYIVYGVSLIVEGCIRSFLQRTIRHMLNIQLLYNCRVIHTLQQKFLNSFTVRAITPQMNPIKPSFCGYKLVCKFH